MLLGEYEHTIDNKNRLTLPAKFRQSFDDGCVVTRGLDGCVFVWTPRAFESYRSSTLADLHPLSQQGRRMQLRDDPARRRALSGLILPDDKKNFCGRKQIASVTTCRVGAGAPTRPGALCAPIRFPSDSVIPSLTTLLTSRQIEQYLSRDVSGFREAPFRSRRKVLRF